ncbi:hypothetical protein [Bradyrhizobium sp. JYMT SZCCT0180]|uniref:hypothetical protein n=1 Tax=Bradyrhizobium sp. JYMT SZCCT0180 TaxID=2807666 RepID=UPI001BADD2A9|nr:hypothetical protein [Bradyrhizobium sp. JYMT SZCCT0180]
MRLIDYVPGNAEVGGAPVRIYNIGNNRPEGLLLVVAVLEKAMRRAATKEMLPTQPGDVLATYADIDDLMRDVDFRPQTSIEDGIAKFVAWYRDHYEA